MGRNWVTRQTNFAFPQALTFTSVHLPRQIIYVDAVKKQERLLASSKAKELAHYLRLTLSHRSPLSPYVHCWHAASLRAVIAYVRDRFTTLPLVEAWHEQQVFVLIPVTRPDWSLTTSRGANFRGLRLLWDQVFGLVNRTGEISTTSLVLNSNPLEAFNISARGCLTHNGG